MMEKDMLRKLQEEVEIPDVVQKKVNAAFDQIHQEAYDSQQRPVVVRTGKVPRKKLWLAIAAAVLALGTVSVGAAAYMRWSSSLGEGMQVTEQQKQTAEESGLADFPGMSVTDGGVTVTAQQSIVDNYCAYLSFKVEGYEPPEGFQPGFDVVDVTVDGAAINTGSSFYDGLIEGEDGRAVRADGQPIPENENGEWILDYTLEDGSMEYRIDISESTEGTALIGKNIHVVLQNLGVYGGKAEDVVTEVEGTWSFDWTLQGDDSIRTAQCSTPLGDTGATITDVEISPISIRVVYDFPRQEIEEPAIDGETGEEFMRTTYVEPPMFTGVKLKDGTLLKRMFGGPGRMGYMGEESSQYEFWGGLDRILDVDQVESLLFIKSYPEEEGGILTEENLYEVPLP